MTEKIISDWSGRTSKVPCTPEEENLVRTAVEKAIKDHTLDLQQFDQLKQIRVVKSSTRQRHDEAFPGESQLIHYDYMDGQVGHRGYLGFDRNNNLITIDVRRPDVDRGVVYQGKGSSPIIARLNSR